MKRILIILLVVLILVVVYLIISRSQHRPLSNEHMENIVSSAIEKYEIPGLTVAVFNSNEILYQTSQGVNAYDTNSAINENHYFHLGSCSKTILSMIAGFYIEEGLFDWSTPIIQMDEDLKTIIHESYEGVTFEDLLLCQAGIPPYTNGEDMLTIDALEIDSLEAFSYYLLSSKSEIKMNNDKYQHVYSNASYAIAAHLLEKITGESYKTLVNEYFEVVLALDVISGWPNLIDPNQPWGHVKQENQLIAIDPNHDYQLHPLLLPAGDLSMPAKDYTIMMQRHLKALLNEDPILSSETYDSIYRGHKGWSLGAYNESMLGIQYVGMDGTSGAFYCRGLLIPESNIGIVIMMNTGSEKATDWITMQIVKSYLNIWWLLALSMAI